MGMGPVSRAWAVAAAERARKVRRESTVQGYEKREAGSEERGATLGGSFRKKKEQLALLLLLQGFV
jgi:hypothetical protein